jgi:hypothetical protein
MLVQSSSSRSRSRSPCRLRQSSLADMRSKAAEAAASLSAAQAESDSTSSLAARLLSHMEAATQRRQEALEMRKTRSAAKQDLLLHRLVSANTLQVHGCAVACDRNLPHLQNAPLFEAHAPMTARTAFVWWLSYLVCAQEWVVWTLLPEVGARLRSILVTERESDCLPFPVHGTKCFDKQPA